MDNNDCRVLKIKELFKELHTLFPDKPLNVLTDVIKSYEPRIKWATSSPDVQTNSYNTWLQACAEHFLISAEQTTSPDIQYACTLGQAKEAATNAMVQQVVFIFPDADEDWVRSTLIYSKRRYGDNIVDRTCNYMFENPFKYQKKKSAPVSDSNSSLSGSEQSTRKDKQSTESSLRIDSSVLGLDSLNDGDLSSLLPSDSTQPRTQSSGSIQNIESRPARTMLSQTPSTSTLPLMTDPEPSTSSSSQRSVPLNSDLAKIVEKKPSTSGSLRIDSDLLQLDSSSDEDLPSFLPYEFEAASSRPSACSELLSSNSEPSVSGLSQNGESKPSTFGSPHVTVSSVPGLSQKGESRPSTSCSPHVAVSSIPGLSQKGESRPSTSSSPHVTVSSVPGLSQKGESKPSTSGSSQVTQSSLPGLTRKTESKPSTSGSLQIDSNLLQLSSSSEEDLPSFLRFDFEASVSKPSLSHAVHSGRQEPSASGVSENADSNASSSSSSETYPSPSSYSTQIANSKPSESSSSSLSVGLSLNIGPNPTRSACPSSVKLSGSTRGERHGEQGRRIRPSSELSHASSSHFQQSMASGDTSSVQCPQLSSTGQGDKGKVSTRKVESSAKYHTKAQARYLAEHLQRKMQQLRCLQRLNSSPDAVSSTSLPVNRKRSSSLEGSGTPNQFKRRTVSQPVLPSASSTSLELDRLDYLLSKEKSHLASSRSQSSTSSNTDQLSSGIKSFKGHLPQPSMYTTVVKGKKLLVKRLQGSRAASVLHPNHHRPYNRGHLRNAEINVPCTVHSDASLSKAGGTSRSVTPGHGSKVRDRCASVVPAPASSDRAPHRPAPSSDSSSVSMRDQTLPAENSYHLTMTSTTPNSRTTSPGHASSSSMDTASKMDSVLLQAMMRRARSSKLRMGVPQARSISASTPTRSSGSASDATSSTLTSTSVTPSSGRTSVPNVSGRSTTSKSYRSKDRSFSASTAGRSPRLGISTQHYLPSTSSARPGTQMSLSTSAPGRSSNSRLSTQHDTHSLPSASPLSSTPGTKVSMSSLTSSGSSTSVASAQHSAPSASIGLETPGSHERYFSVSTCARSLSTSELTRSQTPPSSARLSGRTSASVPSKSSKQEGSHAPVKASTSSAPVSAPDFNSSSSEGSSLISLPKSTCNETSIKPTPPDLSSGSEVLPRDIGLQSVTSGSASPQSPTPKSPDSTNKNIVIIKEDATSSESYILTCESCFLSKDPEGMHQCGDGHVICTKCVEERAKEALSGKTFAVLCPCSECIAVVPRDNLERALPGMILDLLDDKLQTQESALSDPDREDFVRCPSCSFGTVLNLTVKRFVCRSDSCMAVTCRHCRQDWRGRDHSLCERGSSEESPPEGANADLSLQLPSHWSTTDMKGKIFIKELVQPSSQEWANIRALFSKTLADAHLKYIYRVQNPRLWRKYCVTRQNMLEDNGETHLNEKILFHGTAPRVVESICREGFDWRMCGRHGVTYGQGAYFARDAVYSHRYSAQVQQGPRAPRYTTQPLDVWHQIARGYRQLQRTGSAVSSPSDRRPAQTSSTTTSAYAGQTQYSPNVPGASGSGTSTSLAAPAPNHLSVAPSRQVTLQDPNRYLVSINISGSRPQAKRQVIVPSSLVTRAYVSQNPSTSGYNTIQPSSSTAEEEPHRPREYTMFVSKVLVGRSTIGSAEYRKPPRNNSFDDGRTFDSCVDNPDNARIFVIFDSSQAYPEYVINYTI